MLEQRFVRQTWPFVHLLLYLPLVVLYAVFAPAGTVRAQDADPTPQAQPAPMYFPWIGKAPKFTDPTPAPESTDASPNAFLAWQWVDAYMPQARFTLLLEAGDDTPDVVVAHDLDAKAFDPPTFENDTIYYWQVVARSADGRQEQSPVWSFRTEPVYDPPRVGTMVTVPAGWFKMGCDINNTGFGGGCQEGRDLPLHAVWLDAYAIDKYEVTNAQYRECLAAGACGAPRRTNSHERSRYFDNPRYAYYPVLFVSRDNAVQYCTFAGKRLPTEAEWEKAARGSIDTRPFPWGSEDPDCTRQNRLIQDKCDELYDTTRVGSFPRGTSPYGALDMSGNVFEWVVDKAEWGWYYVTPEINPVNWPTKDDVYISIRGGSYRDNLAYLRVYHRHSGHHGDYGGHDAPFFRSDRVGFRCAKSLP